MIIWLLIIALSNGFVLEAEFRSQAECEAGKIEILQNDKNTKVGKCQPVKSAEEASKSNIRK